MNTDLASATLDQMLLMCLLQTKSAMARAYILSETSVDDYGTPYGQEIRKRIDTLMGLGKGLGAAIDFSQDVALSRGAAEFIRGTPGRRRDAGEFSLDQVKDKVYRLKLARNKRTFAQAVIDVNALSVGKVDEETLDKMAEVMEKTLVQVRQGMDRQPLTHIGKRQTTEEAKSILNKLLVYDPRLFVSTGLAKLDALMNGYERGNLVTFSAPSSGGKSTLAMVTAVNQYFKSGHSVVYVSMEMTEKELWCRILSNLSGVPHESIRVPKDMTPAQRSRVGNAWRDFHLFGQKNNCTFTVWDVKESKFTPSKLEQYLAPLMYDVIVVDYITLFNSGKLDRWEMQLEYSRYLKGMAKRLNCVVVLLTQLTDDEKIKYGRGVLENTDYWLHWRWREDVEQATGDVELRLEKARHTKARKVLAKFMLDIMRIETVESIDSTDSVEDRKRKEKLMNSDLFVSAGAF